jgi:phosphoenolpyruvate carboxykinase (diphosphate)
MNQLKQAIGFDPETSSPAEDDSKLVEFVNLKLAARGFPTFGDPDDFPFLKLGESLLASYVEKNRLLKNHLCPVDQRIHNFIAGYLGDLAKEVGEPTFVPANSLVLERHGLARVLSLPPDKDTFASDIIDSYRTVNGVLHNPKSDRRTTKGVFHVAEGGFAVPADKKEVPKIAFARLLKEALNPPKELMRLPFTSSQEQHAELFVSIMLRPVVCPHVDGATAEKSMETRFFAPGNLVSNLDFVESIFGNAGDPYLPDNDSQLDLDHWSGHTGAVILAPQLVRMKKKDLGLPNIADATDRQKKDGMCWETEDEFYNDGGAFKITCRNEKGIIVTLIADNYFGYCKKEVKTQISYAANLYGQVEEEHAGGAVAFPSYDLGEEFHLSHYFPEVHHTFDEVVENFGACMDVKPEGYAVDKKYPSIVYVPSDVHIELHDQTISWEKDGEKQQIHLVPNTTYVLPSGYKVEMGRPAAGRRWRLFGTTAEGTFCHKPCTVSGGGKSEISKPISDAMVSGPVFVADFKSDFDRVEEIVNRGYGQRFVDSSRNREKGRPILSTERSLGSVVKLFTPSPVYTDEHNDYISSIPRYIRDLVFVVKRFWKPDWGEDWRRRFGVDVINGMSGNELKYRDTRLITHYLRVGFTPDGSWRTFSLRKDYNPSRKIQREDDITASITIPVSDELQTNRRYAHRGIKFTRNCEYRFFQRPDDAIVRGYDKHAELDFSGSKNFFSNYEPLSREKAIDIMKDAIRFDQFTEPTQAMIKAFVDNVDGPDYMVCTAFPRIVDGKPTKNPRYLQTRPNLINPRNLYLADMGARLFRKIPLDREVPFPVNAVLAGRRNNPPDVEAKIRPLCVYNPLHYQELPELFMDFIASLTGKSPSTTGAGSEGALTKGPFNALPPIIDLNNSLVSYLVSGYAGFSSAAGWIGPKYRVDHDISLLVPEIWCRMAPEEQDVDYLLENGHLEIVTDFEYEGKTIAGSRLGYRITKKFVHTFCGRILSNPSTLFTEDMLKPELQDMAIYVDGINNIVETQKRVALLYFEDNSVELACPPLKALLHIMAYGEYEGKTLADPEIRELFTAENCFKSDWYQERLITRHEVSVKLAKRFVSGLQAFLEKEEYQDECKRLNIEERLAAAKASLEQIKAQRSLVLFKGTLGTDPSVMTS